MKLEVLSVKGLLLNCEVTSVILPGLEGSFGVLPNHAPFLSILRKGILLYNDPEEKSLEIKGGYVQILDNRVSVSLTD